MGRFSVEVTERSDHGATGEGLATSCTLTSREPTSCTIVQCAPVAVTSCTITSDPEALSCTIVDSTGPEAATSCTITSEGIQAGPVASDELAPLAG